MKHQPCLPALAALFLVCAPFEAQSQTTLEKIRKDPVAASGIHKPYPFPALYDTPAPTGYVPIYISHVGRHGSRYSTNEQELSGMYGQLHRCDSAGLLTPTGKELMRRIDSLYAYSLGHFGALSARGALEHRTIGIHLHDRYPEVFASGKHIEGASSNSVRCILSMTHFVLGLESRNPDLVFDLRSDEDTRRYLLKNKVGEETSRIRKTLVTPVRRKEVRPDRFFASIMTDPAQASRYIHDQGHFMKDLSVALGIVHCLDLEQELELESFLSEEELYALARVDDYDFYGDHAWSVEAGDRRVAQADALTKDIISRADAVLEGKASRAADLRFTHDWMVAPFFAFVGVRGMDIHVPMLEVDRYWMVADYIPMAANIQFVFYRHPDKSTVLVKILLNEQETDIPDLQTETGPYYSWDVLKSWLQQRLGYFSGN